MSARRDLALGVLAWVVVVALGVTLVWAVVSRAGDGVTEGGDALSEAGGAVTSAPDTRTPQGSPRSPGRQRSPDARGSRTAGTTTDAPTSSSSTAVPSATGDQPSAVVRTWQGTAGLVTVECTGAVIRLTGTVPNSGFAYEQDDTGSDDVRVEFEGADGDRRTRVEAACVDGTPVFSVDVDD